MKRILGLSVCVAFLGACATSYQPFQLFGIGGYMEEPMGVEGYRVSYHGNHLTSMETLNTLLLYRCAELTFQQGYDGFRITKGYGHQPISAMGGFRTVEYWIVMYRGITSEQEDKHSYDAKAVLRKFGPYVKKSS